MAAGTDPFGCPGQADDYSKFRPTYPKTLIDEMVKDLPLDCRGVLVDVACGSGQVLRDLAKYFKEAVGVDRSEAQLSQATALPNVHYLKAEASAIPLPDQSVDVMTVGQALHWLPLEQFFKEVTRLVRPGGRLVVLGYSTCTLLDSEATQQAFQTWFDRLESYWQCERSLLEEHYDKIAFPFRRIRMVKADDKKTLPLSSFVHYLRSWSPFQHWLAYHHDEPSCLDTLHSELKGLLGGGEDPPLQLCFPFFAVITAID